MRKLTLKEIREAFPEEKKLVNKLIKEKLEEITAIKNKIIDIMNNQEYSSETKELSIIFIQKLSLDKLVKDYNRLKSYFMEEDNTYSDSIEKAKSVPIETLFELIKPKETSTKVICCCPFHDDKNPSFCIYKATNSYYCFVCSVGGDAISFIQKHNELSFPDAVKYLNNL